MSELACSREASSAQRFSRRLLDALVKACESLQRFARSARRDGELQLSAKLAKEVGSLCASMANVEARIRDAPRVQEPEDEVVAAPSKSNAARKRDRRPDAVVVSAPKPPKHREQPKRAAVAVAMVEMHDGDEPDGHVKDTDAEEPDGRARANKGKRLKEGCVARSANGGIVFVTSVEDDDALVACKDAARKRGSLCCLFFASMYVLTNALLQSRRMTLTSWLLPHWSLF